ncbi:alpha/beta hydrolase [Spirosoma taeanense]|uniref:Alpha/beta hydrolase n=1 Tax=Spirosoma taeanense TaxID=2735870 RepID=A0A6M5Y5W3_9BACT|nr:alpha/beta hydrolase [Spirosoma taeanense]QJW88453.1 alpha/beta hydrolase [Spirosoma taeanense]
MSVLLRNNVRVLGNEKADETLVFAHGFGNDQQAWAEVVPAFLDDYRIVLFDYVGANKQTVPYFNPRKYRKLQSFADDILDIIEELSLENITFIGHSVGGMSGILAAIQEPAWFSRLVLLNASPRYVNGDDYYGGFSQEVLNELFTQMESNFYAWASGFAPTIMANPDRPQLASAYAQTLSAMRPDVALSIAKMIFQSDHRTDVERVRHPTLLIQAKDDVAVPMEVCYYLEKHIPNAELSIIDTQGHHPHISDADKVIKAIKPFINLN